MTQISGIHHITAIAGAPQENLDFYVGAMGLRLVKKSINQDAPDTYHLFFADAEGHPGTDLTFFPWPRMKAGIVGTGVWGDISLTVPPGSLDYWDKRLRAKGVFVEERQLRFGEAVLPFRDPHGMRLSLIETAVYDDQDWSAWEDSPVPKEYQIRNLSAVRITVRDAEATERFLNSSYGFVKSTSDGEWTRYIVGEGAGGQRIDIRVDPRAPSGSWGVGSVHHVAFRVADDDAETNVRSQIISAGGRPTDVIDRFWFKSVYVREPSGALCEIATDGPGFGVDEEMAFLGESLVLPPWYEQHRETIAAGLPELSYEPRVLASQKS